MRTLMLSLTLGLSSALAAPLTVQFTLMNGAQPFAFDQPLQSGAGQDLTVNFWRVYLSHFALVKPDGMEVPVPGVVLADFEPGQSTQNVQVFAGDVPEGTYRGLRFDVGLPRDLNHQDASAQTAPLGVDSGMFWAWNPGYIFSRFEGTATMNSQKVDVALHMGEDQRRLTVNLADLEKPDTIMTVDAAGATVKVAADLAQMMAKGVSGAPFDLSSATYQQVHGGPVADQLYLNLQQAFSLQK